MAGFTKLCSEIVTSSIWSEDNATRIVWVTMLALADSEGRVDASLPGLARTSNVSLEECQIAIRKLSNPDPYSRTPDHEGRRICPVEGGWLILNYGKYRKRRDPEERKRQNREAKRRQRQRECQPKSAEVSQSQPQEAQAEGRGQRAEADVLSLGKKEPKKTAPRFVRPTPTQVSDYGESISYTIDGQAFCDFYSSKGWRIGNTPMKDWRAAVRTWRKRDAGSPTPEGVYRNGDGEFHIPIGPTPQAALDLMDELWPLGDDGKPLVKDGTNE